MKLGDQLIFTDTTLEGRERSTAVEVLDDGVYVGRGSASESVDKFRFAIESVSGKSQRTAQFVVRECYDERDANNCMESFKTLKKYGLKTWNTCRQSGKHVLLTSGSTEDRVAICGVAGNDSGDRKEVRDRGHFTELTNFPEMLEEIYEHATKALKAGVYLSYDAYLFSVSRHNKSTDVDFIIGDLNDINDTGDYGADYQYGNVERAVSQFLSIVHVEGQDGLNPSIYERQAEVMYERYRSCEP